MSVPYVIEKDEKNQERVYDLYSRLLKDRIVFISGRFTSELANSVVAQLLFLEADGRDKDIYVYINSPGGEITAMYAIYDTIKYIRPDVVTIGFGQVASAGSFILAAGTKGKRYALENTEIMLHELSGGMYGKATDVAIDFKRMEYHKNKMARQYSEMTGKPVKRVLKDLERDFWMTPEEAIKYGVVDEVQIVRK
jgi:ATP-dependent Clp protease protease subunit